MRVLVAPQEFKGSLTATEAARAIATGLTARATWQLDVVPMSDGGPGFIDALAAAMVGERKRVATIDCLGGDVSAEVLVTQDGRTAFVEAAQSNGLELIPKDRRDPLAASTEGVGQMIQAANACSRITIGVGGSATTDGGSGVARALGAAIIDADGAEVARGGGALQRVSAVHWSPPEWLRNTKIIVASDVTNPLLGPGGAAYVYGPQKGATPTQVETLERGLARWARVVERDLRIDIRDLPGAGAAGGLAGGLVAFLGADVESGFDVVAKASRLHERLEAADVVVTGEGSFDSQSASGKTTGRLIKLAKDAGKKFIIFAGRAERPDEAVRTLEGLEPSAERTMAEAGPLLTELARAWAESLPGDYG